MATIFHNNPFVYGFTRVHWENTKNSCKRLRALDIDDCSSEKNSSSQETYPLVAIAYGVGRGARFLADLVLAIVDIVFEPLEILMMCFVAIKVALEIRYKKSDLTKKIWLEILKCINPIFSKNINWLLSFRKFLQRDQVFFNLAGDCGLFSTDRNQAKSPCEALWDKFLTEIKRKVMFSQQEVFVRAL